MNSSETIESALKKPVYPLYLGRRACPASYDLVLGIREESAEEALRSLEWQVPEYRRKDFPSPVALRILRDALPGERGDLVRDIPVSFSPEYRQYAAREVVTVEPLVLENPSWAEASRYSLLERGRIFREPCRT